MANAISQYFSGGQYHDASQPPPANATQQQKIDYANAVLGPNSQDEWGKKLAGMGIAQGQNTNPEPEWDWQKSEMSNNMARNGAGYKSVSTMGSIGATKAADASWDVPEWMRSSGNEGAGFSTSDPRYKQYMAEGSTAEQPYTRFFGNTPEQIERNKAIAAQTGYKGNFSGGQYQAWENRDKSQPGTGGAEPLPWETGASTGPVMTGNNIGPQTPNQGPRTGGMEAMPTAPTFQGPGPQAGAMPTMARDANPAIASTSGVSDYQQAVMSRFANGGGSQAQIDSFMAITDPARQRAIMGDWNWQSEGSKNLTNSVQAGNAAQSSYLANQKLAGVNVNPQDGSGNPGYQTLFTDPNVNPAWATVGQAQPSTAASQSAGPRFVNGQWVDATGKQINPNFIATNPDGTTKIFNQATGKWETQSAQSQSAQSSTPGTGTSTAPNTPQNSITNLINQIQNPGNPVPNTVPPRAITPSQPMPFAPPGEQMPIGPQTPNQANPWQQAQSVNPNTRFNNFQSPLAPTYKQYESTAFNYADDPGASFRRSQAEQALQRRQLASGDFFSGGAMKELAELSDGMAAQDYNNAFSRYMQTDASGFRNNQANNAGMLGNWAANDAAQSRNDTTNYNRGETADNKDYARWLTDYGLGRQQDETDYNRSIYADNTDYQRFVDEYGRSTTADNTNWERLKYLDESGLRAALGGASGGNSSANAIAQLLAQSGVVNANGTIGSNNATTSAITNLIYSLLK